MAAMKVHGNVFSTATQRVVACLIEKDLDYEFVPVDMKSGEHKKDHFLCLNVSTEKENLKLIYMYVCVQTLYINTSVALLRTNFTFSDLM